ncbi:hypothetical protein HK101_005765, partial [Irineochytrium annulatum]
MSDSDSIVSVARPETPPPAGWLEWSWIELSKHQATHSDKDALEVLSLSSGVPGTSSPFFSPAPQNSSALLAAAQQTPLDQPAMLQQHHNAHAQAVQHQGLAERKSVTPPPFARLDLGNGGGGTGGNGNARALLVEHHLAAARAGGDGAVAAASGRGDSILFDSKHILEVLRLAGGNNGGAAAGSGAGGPVGGRLFERVVGRGLDDYEDEDEDDEDMEVPDVREEEEDEETEEDLDGSLALKPESEQVPMLNALGGEKAGCGEEERPVRRRKASPERRKVGEKEVPFGFGEGEGDERVGVEEKKTRSGFFSLYFAIEDVSRDDDGSDGKGWRILHIMGAIMAAGIGGYVLVKIG